MSRLSITEAELEEISVRTNVSPVDIQEGQEESNSLRRKVYLTLEDPTFSLLARILAVVNVLLISLSIVTFVIISLPRYLKDPPTYIFIIEAVLTAIWTLEYIVRFITVEESRLPWIFDTQNVADILSVIPFYIELIVQDRIATLGIIRAIRLLRLARVLKFKRFTTVLKDFYTGQVIKYGLARKLPYFNYLGRNLGLQAEAVIPIAVYMIVYQFITLGSISHDLGIVIAGQIAVIFGLFLYLEGLTLGFMPLSELIGRNVAKQLPMWGVLLVSFLMGIIVTFAEPAVSSLSALTKIVSRKEAPYLVYILDQWNWLLLFFVGCGVGFAAILGMLRFKYSWTLKKLVYISLIPLIATTCILMWVCPDLHILIGLAWDCGAITTGSVTVPIVLALGLGISDHYSGGGESSKLSGFGIVTLASLYPIFAAELLALLLLTKSKESIVGDGEVTETEHWEETSPYAELIHSLRAVGPLTAFLLIVAVFVLKQRPKKLTFSEIVSPGEPTNETPSYKPLAAGFAAAFFGMIIFNYGLTYGLTKLGEEVGSLLPGAFTELDEVKDSPRYSYGIGLFITVLFAWLLGFFATKAEPALSVLGSQVEEFGVMRKKVLVMAVSLGVATGMAIGVIKIIYDLPLVYFIIGGYALAVILTHFSSELLVNIAWDSAGVTTGDVTVPFVLTIGVSIASAVKVTDGFGILTLASLGPILSVLIVGLVLKIRERLESTELGKRFFRKKNYVINAPS